MNVSKTYMYYVCFFLNVTNDEIKSLTNLIYLNLYSNYVITNDEIKSLINL